MKRVIYYQPSHSDRLKKYLLNISMFFILLTAPAFLWAADQSKGMQQPEVANVKAERDALRGQVEQLTDRNRQLNEELANKDAASDKLKSENSRLSNELEKNRTKVQTFTDDIDRLQSNLDEQKKQISNTNKSLAEARGLIDGMKKESASQNQQLVHLQSALEETKQAKQELEHKRVQTEQRFAKKEKQLTENVERTALLEAELAGSFNERGRLKSEVAELNNNLSRCKITLDVTDGTLSKLRQDHVELKKNLMEVRAKLPIREGGTASIDEVGTEVSAAASAYQKLYRTRGVSAKDPAYQAELKKAGQALNAKQMLYASVSGARGVYHVRAGDTLAQIAQRMYGDGNQWAIIFEANRHVLDNPDYVVHGFSVVVP